MTYRQFLVSDSLFQTSTDSSDESTADSSDTTEELSEEELTALKEEMASTMAADTAHDEQAFINAAYENAQDSAKESYADESYTLKEDQLYSSLSSDVADWLFDASRTEGDTTYMEEARAKADEILAEFNAGDKTAESFGELAKENTDDSNGDEGGLYENIMPGQMVTEFNDWCFDESRQPGDTGIVETSYGVHVMYFDGFGNSYRDTLVENALRTADYNAWHDGVVGDNAYTTVPFGMKFTTK